jgi:cephalosporin hydroxylase
VTQTDPHDPKDPALVAGMAADPEVQRLGRGLFDKASEYRYSYNFTWLGRPVIQWPQDIMALQELIWKVRPDVIVETGIAHGGSLIFTSSMLELLGGDGRVIGVDIDIRAHNRAAIEEHPMFKRITMIEGSSIDEGIVGQVRDEVGDAGSVLLILDSNHTHDHVLRELELYAPMVTKGSYVAVMDTVVEDMPGDAFPDRPWDRGDNPATAVKAYLASEAGKRFEVDQELSDRLILSVAPGGYLRCIA